jgi:hypothetical protein
MTRQEIKLKAPSVFATSPSPGMSKNYVFVPTFEVVEKFEQDALTATVKRKFNTDGLNQQQLATTYKVKHTVIWQIVHNKTWKE